MLGIETYRRVPLDVCAMVILAVHLLVMVAFWAPVSTGPDSNGYYIQTRLLVDEGQLWASREQMLQYISPHWLVVNDDTLISRYPPGLALLQAVPYWLFGSRVTLLNPLLTTGALVAVYLLSRFWLGSRWALLALGIAALNPVANSWTYMGDAHPACAFFVLWGMYFLSLWTRKPDWLMLPLIGLWFGLIPTFRYPELLYLAGGALFVLIHQHWSWKGLAQSIVFGVAGIVPLALVYTYNYTVFGGVGETGYGTGEQLFSAWFFAMKIVPYFFMIIGYGVAGFALLGMAGMVWLCRNEDTRAIGALFAGIVLPVTLIYTAYFFFDASLRFLMPTFSIYIVAGVWYLKHLHEAYPVRMKRWTPIIISITLVVALIQSGFGLSFNATGHTSLVVASETIQQQVPQGSVIIAPQSVQYQLDFMGGWKLVDNSVVNGQQARPSQRPARPDRPDGQRPDRSDGQRPPERGRDRMKPGGMDNDFMQELMQFHVRASIQEHYKSDQPGTVSPVVWEDIKCWAEPNREFYWIGNAERIHRLIGDEFECTKLAEFEAPQGGMMGGPPQRGERGRDERPPAQENLTLVKLTW